MASSSSSGTSEMFCTASESSTVWKLRSESGMYHLQSYCWIFLQKQKVSKQPFCSHQAFFASQLCKPVLWPQLSLKVAFCLSQGYSDRQANTVRSQCRPWALHSPPPIQWYCVGAQHLGREGRGQTLPQGSAAGAPPPARVGVCKGGGVGSGALVPFVSLQDSAPHIHSPPPPAA